MADIFERMGNYFPLFTLVVLWLIVAPVRLLALLLLPPVTPYNHPLRNLREFFAFDWN